MVVTVTVKDLVLLAAIALVRDLTDDFEAFLVRFRTGVCVVNAAHARHFGNQLFCEQSARNRACCAAKEIHLHKLVTHSICDAFAAIANINGPNATGYSISMLLAVLIPDVDAFAFDDHLRLAGLKTFVLDQMVPHVRTICVDDFGIVVVFECTVHLHSPFFG